jgi:hypothetical protein
MKAEVLRIKVAGDFLGRRSRDLGLTGSHHALHKFVA